MAITPARLIAGSQIAASATTYYTATNKKARIDAMTLCNTTGGAITVDIHLVPSGGSATASNQILQDYSVAANSAVVVTQAIGHWLEAGGTIQASASAATSVTLVASGVEYTS